MSNFVTADIDYEKYAKLATSAESLIYSDARSSLTVFGTFGEQLVKEIMHLDKIVDWKLNQKERIEKLARSNNDYPAAILGALNILRLNRNKATHDDQFVATPAMALKVDKLAFKVWQWFLEAYSQDKLKDYQIPKDNRKIIQNQAEEIKRLTEQIEKMQAEAQKIKVVITPEEQERRHKVNVNYAKKHHLSEAETRQLIDEQLKEAGWEADSVNLNNQTKKTLPEKGRNMAIAEWVLPNGQRADYALFRDLEFYGIVEAKRWDEDIAGQLAQPKEYSREVTFSTAYTLVNENMGQYQVPFIYTANGRPYLKQYQEKSGIWFWDARNPKESSYALESFHSPDDLKLKLTATSKEDADQKLAKDEDFPHFIDKRDYQVEAVKAIEAAVAKGQRRILLSMATGTGKTRTAIALMYRLLLHKRVRRILYLVDRRSLGEQTAGAIKDNKIGANTIAEIYGLKELNDKMPEATTKIQIATVQGMIKRLFFNEDEKDKPTVGQYDFIIVDEAHRGYAEDKDLNDNEYKFYNQDDYVSQYRRVVDYFDATALGMTATPALQTTEIFGQPVYTYSYQQAVIDGYLVDHDAPTVIKTKLSQEGIHFKKNASVSVYNEAEQTIATEKLPDDMDFDVSDFNKQVINESFNKVVCEQLAKQYLDPNDSSQGKTLIFAANDAHADMIVGLLKKAFKDAGNPVDDDAIEKITGSLRHPDYEIRRFKNEQYPNIAVTVDLLTTGVDVPKITNLVFLRRVKFRILYEQMLGRATRLCPEINKSIFHIYDAVGIYEAMNKVTNMKPVVKDPGHNVHYFMKHKKDFFEVQDNTTPYQTDMAGAVERKIKRMNNKNKKKFEQLTQIHSIENWARSLSKLSKDKFMEQWNNLEILDKMNLLNGAKKIISNEEDEFVGASRNYGNSENSKAYLDNFAKYIQDHLNVEGIYLIVNDPAKLTLDELKQVKLQLEEEGFNINQLRDAWKEEEHRQTTADIISFIRNAANGSELVDHAVRIHNAMQKVRGMTDWNPKQEKWLTNIENELLSNDLLGPDAKTIFDGMSYFKTNGGYRRMKKIFDENIDQIIVTLNENLYV
ncbi:type I restriction-modification system endonuclease [Lactobacillus sp. PSON]|uniref:type I restriction-modification system endonuclease n=1 Tax=Lactobacillus sp. PSON TaxID=3455454 RepID=UPI0040416858